MQLDRCKPWTIDTEQLRREKIDNMATKIMTEEALKIINEAYEAVFKENDEGKSNTEKAIEEEVQVNDNTDNAMEDENDNIEEVHVKETDTVSICVALKSKEQAVPEAKENDMGEVAHRSG